MLDKLFNTVYDATEPLICMAAESATIPFSALQSARPEATSFDILFLFFPAPPTSSDIRLGTEKSSDVRPHTPSTLDPPLSFLLLCTSSPLDKTDPKPQVLE